MKTNGSQPKKDLDIIMTKAIEVAEAVEVEIGEVVEAEIGEVVTKDHKPKVVKLVNLKKTVGEAEEAVEVEEVVEEEVVEVVTVKEKMAIKRILRRVMAPKMLNLAKKRLKEKKLGLPQQMRQWLRLKIKLYKFPKF